MRNPQTPKPPNSHTQPALIVFAKRPEPGHVKTRLTPVLTPEEAARLYDAFLQDALLQYSTLDVSVRLYFSPPLGEESPDLVPDDVGVFEQQGPTLGARMKRAFRETFDAGFEHAVIIGTDHPTLPRAFIEQAFEALTAPRALCLGPSADGGYYLLGMNAFYPQLFEDMTYSHAGVFAETLARVTQTDAQLTVLPRWYDVDTPAALHRMIGDLEDATVSAPHTRRVVAALDLDHLTSRSS